MADKGFEVGTLHADNDATSQSRLPSTITKKEDKSHVKKKTYLPGFTVYQKSTNNWNLQKLYHTLSDASCTPFLNIKAPRMLWKLSWHQLCLTYLVTTLSVPNHGVHTTRIQLNSGTGYLYFIIFFTLWMHTKQYNISNNRYRQMHQQI